MAGNHPDPKWTNALITIQKYVRLYLSKKKLAKELFKKSWSHLDTDEEKMTIINDDKYGDINDIIAKSKMHKKKKTDESKFVVETDYKGPHLSHPTHVDHKFVHELIRAYKSNILLHYKYAYTLVKLMKEYLEKHAKNINEITIPRNGRVIVVGDTHGQLPDLLTILDLGGMPSATNVYVFNGDFVDRGFHGPEVLFIIYSLCLAFPHCVYLNRGNHEQRRMNEKYHFEDQIRQRYDPELYDLIADTFLLLPLCTLIEHKVLVLHGGLFQFTDVTLDEIIRINRLIDLPRHKHLKHRSEFIMEQILWSDPRDIDGWQMSDRGAGILFGQEVTENFCQRNGLQLVIRSHEMVDEGYLENHDGLLYTLFSASYYCGSNDNQGAIAIFEDKTIDRYVPNFKQYYADIADMLKTHQTGHKGRKSETLAQLYARIYNNRSALAAVFEQLDDDKDGYLTRKQWIEGMKQVLKLPLSWATLQPYIATVEHRGINYTKFLERYKIEVDEKVLGQWRRTVVSKICAKIYEKFKDLKEAFAAIDADHSGKISYKEFLDLIRKYNIGLTNEQVYDFMRSVDTDQDGAIDYGEFVARFSVHFDRLVKEEDKHWLDIAVKEIGHALLQRHEQLKHAFEEMDTDQSGTISYKEFSIALQTYLGLEEKYDKTQRQKIFDYIDLDKNGKITFDEFMQAFTVVDNKASKWEEYVLQQIYTALHKSQTQLARVFKAMDTDNSGKIDVREFQQALEAMNIVLEDGEKLSELQVRHLHHMLDTDGDGLIDYQELIDSLKVVDVTKRKSPGNTPRSPRGVMPIPPWVQSTTTKFK
jgi:protein phosphatase